MSKKFKLNLCQVGIAIASAFTVLLWEAVVRDVSAKVNITPNLILASYVEIAGFFLGEAKIGTAATRIDLPPLNSTGMQLTQQPLVVLVNQGTASAAELLAGSLQDSKRATIIGTPTIGKGLIHSLQPLADNSGIIVTLGKLLTPNGRDILISGIEPDILSDATSSPLLDPNIEPASLEDIQYLEAVGQLKKIVSMFENKSVIGINMSH